jgi:poly(A) polymerase/tRNA nucleotidyltransferase (CCA-adding enzyme)
MVLMGRQNLYGVSIPEEVKFIIEKLKENDFKAYIVGGCVRDLLRGVEPEDWDVATDAKPEEIGKIFLRSFSNNNFGTVTVLTGSENQRLKEIEITPFRIDEKYTDKRHPDKIRWAKNIEEDLARRDFTVNAIAIKQETRDRKQEIKIIDPYEGRKDLEDKIIRAVGRAKDRFNEDALRMMRAVRFAATLGFKIEAKTEKAIKTNSPWLQMISKERIRDEFLKIIMSERADEGVELLRKLSLLKYIIPELEEGFGVSQNKHHIYECYQHSILSLKYAAKKSFNKYVRLTSLFHDIAKPRVKEGRGQEATFYNHEIVGAKMTIQILSRLKFPKKDIEKITKLVRYHLFYYNVDEVSEASVRRLVRKVGPESMEELLQVRMADRIGSGVPKAEPYKLRHLKYIIDRVSQDPISVKMIKVNGEDIMKILKIKPGPKVGQVLDILLNYVLEKPNKNEKEFLEKEIKKLGKFPEEKLKVLAQKARKAREIIETKRDEMTKKKYWVT